MIGIRKIVLLLILVLVSLTVVGCAPANKGDGKAMENTISGKIAYKDITPADAKKRLSSEKEIILLDVRTIEEYAEKHIPKSTLIPVEVIEKEAQLKLKEKSAPIFVYCRSGNRSVTASKILVKQGYTNVFNLGGIIDWPYETEVGPPK